MKLKLDENLGRAAAAAFQSAGHDTLTVLEQGPRLSHQDLLDACSTLITGLGKGDIVGKLWIVQRGRIREHQGTN